MARNLRQFTAMGPRPYCHRLCTDKQACRHRDHLQFHDKVYYYEHRFIINVVLNGIEGLVLWILGKTCNSVIMPPEGSVVPIPVFNDLSIFCTQPAPMLFDYSTSTAPDSRPTCANSA